MKTKLSLLRLAFISGALVILPQVNGATDTITLSVSPGYCLLANHLRIGNNTLDVVLPNVPVETQVLKFANGNYLSDIFDGSHWLDSLTGNPSTTTVNPGEGFFLFNPILEDVLLTFTGDIPEGPVTICFPPGYSLAGSPVPKPFSPNAEPAFPRVLEMQILRYIRAGQPGGPGYGCVINDGFIWQNCATGEPSTATIPIGEGFFVFNPGFTPFCWTRIYSTE
jgi:hypothetical protein